MTDLLDKTATRPVLTRRHGDVLIILSNTPPVNALSTAVRQGLVDAIAEAEADDAVKAVVIACEGQTFFAGADITEFGKPPQQPWLAGPSPPLRAPTPPSSESRRSSRGCRWSSTRSRIARSPLSRPSTAPR